MASDFGFPAYGGNEKKVFISYKKSNESRVAPFVSELARYGINVWYDQAGGEGIALGALWQQTISENMMLSSVVLAFISRDTFTTNGYMLTELIMAQNMNLPIIPIYIDPPYAIQAAMPVAYTAQWTQLNQYQCFDISAMGFQQALTTIASAANYYMQNDTRNISALKAKIESEHKKAGIVSDSSGNLSSIPQNRSGSNISTGKKVGIAMGIIGALILLVLLATPKVGLSGGNPSDLTGNDPDDSYYEEIQQDPENGDPDSENIDSAQSENDTAENTEKKNEACVYLGKDITAYNSGLYYKEYDGTSSFNLGGVAYRRGFTIGTYDGGGLANFNLGGKYSCFAGVAGNVDGVNYSVVYNVLGDGELLGTIEIQGGSLPVSFEFNVSGVKQLSIAATGRDNFGEGVGFGNAVLYNDPADKPVLYESNELPNTAYLAADISAYVSGLYYEEYNGLSTFSLAGETYLKGFTIGTYTGGGYANFNIDGNYTNLSGVAGNVDGVNYSVIYTVIGDGEPLGTIEIIGGGLPTEFSFDITGVKQLSFNATGNRNLGEGVGFGNVVLE